MVKTFEKFFHWLLHDEGSSRSSALIRIGLVFLIWSRWAEELQFFRNLDPLLLVLSANFFASTLLMLVGYKTRLSTIWVFLVLFTMYYYFGYSKGVEPWTHHHTYLLMIASLFSALSPSGKSYSVDRYLGIRAARKSHASIPDESGNLAGLRLMVIQLSVIYLWAAIDKSNVVWMSGARMEHYFMYFYSGPTYPDWPFFSGTMVFLAIYVLILEYILAFALPFARTRRIFVWLGLILHLSFYVLLPVSTYSLTMILLYLAYYDPEAVHDFIELLHGRK